MRALDYHQKVAPTVQGLDFDMVYLKLRRAYLLEVNLTQILADHETLFIVYNVRIYVDFSSIIITLCPYAFHPLVWSESDDLNFFDQWEILNCNGHGPLVSCMKWPLGSDWPLIKDAWSQYTAIYTIYVGLVEFTHYILYKCMSSKL